MGSIKRCQTLHYMLTQVVTFQKKMLTKVVNCMELSDRQGDEIVSNPGSKTPVWKLFGFPGNGKWAPRTKRKVVCRLCQKELPYKINTTDLYVHLKQYHKEEHTTLRPTISL